MQTSDDDRFLRFTYGRCRDYGAVTGIRPMSGRWFVFSKGGRLSEMVRNGVDGMDWDNPVIR